MSDTQTDDLNHAAKHQAYLQELHRGLNTPDNVLYPIIEEATGSDVVAKDRIVKGESNEVYDVELADGIHVIVRISRKEADRFERERWALEQCSATGVPVPQILHISSAEHDGEPLGISIQTKLAGRSIRDIQQADGMSEERLQAILREAGRYLGMMHRIETDGHGRIDGNGKGKFPTDWDSVLYQIHSKDTYLKAASHHDLEAHKIEAALGVLQDRTYEYTDTPRLQHLDLGPDHIFVDDNDKVVGFIDFEGAGGGDPIRDFARWHYLYRKQMPVDWLLAGYPKDMVPADFEQRLHRNRV